MTRPDPTIGSAADAAGVKSPVQHTPGPWTWAVPDSSACLLLGRDDDIACASILTATRCKSCAEKAVSDANGPTWRCGFPRLQDMALIAAAPEMLEALQVVEPEMDELLRDSLQAHCLLDAELRPRRDTLEADATPFVEALEVMLAKVRAAIAKATRAECQDGLTAAQRWLRPKLKERSLSQAAFAEAIGMSPSALSLLLSGKRRLQIAELERIVSVLQTDPVEVIRGMLTDTESRAAGAASVPAPILNPKGE